MEIPRPETRFIGRHIMQYDNVVSTNDLLFQKVKSENLHEGATLIASEQMGGKGQGGKSWESRKGQNLLMSIYLKPDFLVGGHMPMLAAAVALGVRAVIQRHLPSKEVVIKWPNDILCNDRKLCGILIENHHGNGVTTIVGIGMNAFQTEFSRFDREASSLKLENSTFELPISNLCEEVCLWLERYYMTLRQPNGPQQIRDLYVSQLYRLNEEIIADGELCRVDGITLSGRLVLTNTSRRLEIEHNEKQINWNL